LAGSELIRYDSARRQLAEVSRVDEAADIRNKAAALQAYARQRNDIELEAWVSEIKLRAAMRIGELSKELETNERSRTDLHPAAGRQTKTATLKAAGVSTSAANRYEKLAEHADQVEAYIAKKVKQRKPVKFTEVMAAVERQAKDDKQRDRLHEIVEHTPGLHVGDFRDKASLIADESVELIFTDPPYDRDSIPLFADAAREAARILKPGGSFVAYCGNIQLPEVLRLCSEHLRYWWTIANFHSEGTTWMQRYGIHTGWKPLVWFVKGTRGDVQVPVNDVVSGGREKLHHAWGQAESEAAYYIEHLTSPGGLVVDFFVGGGTTIVAAESLGRPWVGFEEDPVVADRASKRLSGSKAA